MSKLDVAILGVVGRPLHPIWKGARVAWVFSIGIGIWLSVAEGSLMPLAAQVPLQLALVGLFALLVRADQRLTARRNRERHQACRDYGISN